MSERESEILLLTKLQYCHVIDNNTGIVRLVEGPFRGPLESNEMIHGKIENKLIVREGQYAVVLNPYDKAKKDIKHGDWEVRIGPMMFSLYPGEELKDGIIRDEYVLEKDKGLLMKALRDFKDGEKQRHAGDLWIVEGPTHYIPHKYADVQEIVSAISLGRDEGIYVKNIRTGEIRIEKGPKVIMLQPDETLYYKNYSDEEIEAMNLDDYDLEFYHAIPLKLLKNEVMMITDGENQRIEFGPKVILLGPFEYPYIMDISGSTPKKPHVLKIWKVMLGPIFSTDELSVRTKDNAVLQIQLRYKWRFVVDEERPQKIFAVEDFIGFATETMAGLIREEAAKHNFETFHSNAAELIKNRIFSKETNSFTFKENGFEIFGIDIKKIHPEDADIAAQLNAAIKSNMEVYVKKIQQSAELEAERELVKGKIEIEQSKTKLIQLEQANYRESELGKAKIESEAAIERAKGRTEAMKIEKNAQIEMEIDRINKIIAELQKQGGNSFIKLEQVRSFNNVKKTIIVPTDSKLFVPLGNMDILNDDSGD